MDDLQWLALERPNAAIVVRNLVRGLAAKHRPPQPVLAFTFSRHLEYLEINVANHRALLAPLEAHIGKRMPDIAPPDLMEKIDRKIHAVRQTRTPQVQRYTSLDGQDWDAQIIVPDIETVVIKVTEPRP